MLLPDDTQWVQQDYFFRLFFRNLIASWQDYKQTHLKITFFERLLFYILQLKLNLLFKAVCCR